MKFHLFQKFLGCFLVVLADEVWNCVITFLFPLSQNLQSGLFQLFTVL